MPERRRDHDPWPFFWLPGALTMYFFRSLSSADAVAYAA
jgi:hypothetical protein